VVILVEGGVLSGEGYESGCYETCNCEQEKFIWNCTTRNFCSVLYLLKYSGTVENALENEVAQGLSCDYD
jgi:aldehyde dehydrogenase (NAD+)